MDVPEPSFRPTPRTRWSLIAAGLVRVGLPRIIAEVLQRRRLTILLYHDPSEATIATHLAALTRTYSVVSLRAAVEALRAGSLASLPPKPLVITFDDGHRRNIRLMESFKAYDVCATIFLCSGIVGTRRRFWFHRVDDPEPLKRVEDSERMAYLADLSVADPVHDEPEALDEEQVGLMVPRFDFQSHTRTHPILPMCSDDKARAEIVESRRELEDLELDVFALSYPNGDYGDREVTLAREAGYQCAITVDPGFNSPSTDLYRMRRICINDDADGPDELLLKACGVWDMARQFVRSLAAVRRALR
jgi:peptidoglycan/xylan/chitin deacetylase (PgdA/CDA1 family)